MIVDFEILNEEFNKLKKDFNYQQAMFIRTYNLLTVINNFLNGFAFFIL